MNSRLQGSIVTFRRMVVVILAGALCLASVPASTGAPTEYEVKAVFIYNFARYIQWPPSAVPDARRAFVVGLIGKDPFGPTLDHVMRGQSIADRAVVVRRFGSVEDIVNCDILFVASSERKNLRGILDALDRAPVLTVGDMDQFAERGGMINLTTEANRIRFEVNLEAVSRARLKAGSKLLRLAKIVDDRQAGIR